MRTLNEFAQALLLFEAAGATMADMAAEHDRVMVVSDIGPDDPPSTSLYRLGWHYNTEGYWYRNV